MCDDPLMIQPEGYHREVPVGCGKCPPCLKRRIDSWIVRLRQEDFRSSSSYFITLTYAPVHVPRTSNGFMTLKREDLTNYWKRLRKRNPQPIKYYAVGEYGEKNSRPHYHAIVFNVADELDIHKAWTIEGVPLGGVHVGQLSNSSIAYCAKYVDKKKGIPVHKRDDRLKEFSVMSRHLGDNFLTPAMKLYYLSDLTRMSVVLGGKRVALPRYYRDKIFADHPELKEEAYGVIAEQMLEQTLELRRRMEKKGKDFVKVMNARKRDRAMRYNKNAKKNRTL